MADWPELTMALPGGTEYDRENIAWRTGLPAPNGFGGPIVVGGRIFLQSEPADLIRPGKRTGEIRWIRSNSHNELATDEGERANADIFKEIEPLAARLGKAGEPGRVYLPATGPQSSRVQVAPSATPEEKARISLGRMAMSSKSLEWKTPLASVPRRRMPRFASAGRPSGSPRRCPAGS